MKTHHYLGYIIILLLLGSGCKKEDEGPKTSGTFILSTEIFSSESAYFVYAYAFSKGDKVKYGGEFTNNFDILLIDQYDNPPVNVIGAKMSAHPSIDNAYGLIGSHNSREDALSAFENYNEAGNIPLTNLTGVLNLYDLWLVKTMDNKYAKVMVEEITINKDDPEQQHVTVKFRYVYQPDGSTMFPE